MRIRTVADLIARLEECDQDALVAIASQPMWPFEHLIHDVGQGEDGKVYLAEGEQVGYLSAAARRVLNW